MTDHGREQARGAQVRRRVPALPSPARCRRFASVAALVVVATYWMALQPGADAAQAAFVRWVNDPPHPISVPLAATNSLCRPLPLAVVTLALFAWVMVTARGSARWEVLRAMAIGFVLSEAITQILKRMADQPRPTASVLGLDVHGYPKDPYGNAYPSAHTGVAVGVVTALWPWLTRAQRAVGVAIAVLVALNRLYIGAHWPVDVVGGAAVGLLSGAACWLVAIRWPVERGTPHAPSEPRPR